MRIQHNISALNTYRQLSVNNTGTAKSLEKLSSGYKVNRAGDDAAGLAISEKMRAQINGLNRASANAQDGISLIQAAEGALQETHSILQRMRELAVQAANDVNETQDRQAIQDEINQLTKEVDRIAFTTEFNKKNILDGSQSTGKFIRTVSGSNISSLSIIPAADPDTAAVVNGYTAVAVTQAGEKFNRTFDFSLITDTSTPDLVSKMTTQDGAIGTITIDLSDDMKIAAGLPVATTGALTIAVNTGETGTTIASSVRETLQNLLGADFDVTTDGAKVNVAHKFVGEYATAFATFTFSTAGVFAVGEDFAAAAEGTEGKDVGIEINGAAVDLTENNSFIYTENGAMDSGFLRGRDSIALLVLGDGEGATADLQFRFKIDDATKLSGAIVAVNDGNDLTLQVGANTGYTQTIKIAIESLSASSLGISTLNVLNHGDSQSAIASVETAITMVSTQRAALGAVQNRLEHTVANLDTVAENLQSAESRIRDVDMAKEMMNFTKFNILVQASQAMMAQANAQPQGVLQLLR